MEENTNTNTKKVVAGIAIVVLLAIGFTVYWQFFRANSPVENVDQNQVVTNEQSTSEARLMTAVHQFKAGKHTIVGQTDLPTSCHVLKHTERIAESFPEQVTVAFTTASNNSDVCAQLVTSVRYKIEFNASQNAVIGATWNGEPVQFNLVPAGPNDNLDNLDIYIKG